MPSLRRFFVLGGLIIVSALGFVLIATPAEAQTFVCGGSANGAEPQGSGGSTATGFSPVACGLDANATGDRSVAIGDSVIASGLASTAIGQGVGGNTTATGNTSIAIGAEAHSRNSLTIAIGGGAAVDGQNSIGIGGNIQFAPAVTDNSVAIGGNNNVGGKNVVLLGFNAQHNGDNSTSIGVDSVAMGSAVALGQGAKANAIDSIAVGQGSSATGQGATAVGQGATAGFVNSTAIGQGVATTRVNQVAVGTAANTYTMAGITSAASLAAQSGPVSVVTSDANGNLATMNMSGIATAGSVAALDSRVSVLETSVNNLNYEIRKAYEGTAVAIAMGGAMLPDNKRFAISGNLGTFNGENAFGGVAQVRLSDHFVANAALGAGFARGGVGGRIGGTLAW